MSWSLARIISGHRRSVSESADWGLTTWIVYAPNAYLARTYPRWTTQDALGNSYPSHLCISAPDVRSYYLALTEDVVEQFRPDVVWIENVNFLPFGASFFNPLLLSKMTAMGPVSDGFVHV